MQTQPSSVRAEGASTQKYNGIFKVVSSSPNGSTESAKGDISPANKLGQPLGNLVESELLSQQRKGNPKVAEALARRFLRKSGFTPPSTPPMSSPMPMDK